MGAIKRVYCKPTMLKGYIDSSVNRNLTLERFWNILSLDFCPNFLKQNEVAIKKIYTFKLEIRQEQKSKFSLIRL